MSNFSVPRSRQESPAPQSAQVPVRAGAGSRDAVRVGETINGKYLVEAIIGEGGVGVVARAKNLELDEPVALKFLKPEMLGQEEIVGRFLREAKAASSIRNEYVCTVFDVGTTAEGAPFIVMEMLDGKDLGSIVQERGPLPVREASEYVMQACEALALAHAKGIVHRDIKPENLFLAARAGVSLVKVLDFGISKTALTGSVFGSALPEVRTVSLMGTPLYMSPEQVRSADSVDSRSDIWSLGMVLYELLTGKVPFAATTITEACAAILEAPFVPVSEYRKDLPPGFEEALDRCLSRDMGARFQNMAEVAIAFMPFAPRRARVCAERAAEALRAAKLIDESALRFSTAPPPSDQNLVSTSVSPQMRSVPASPRVPSFSVGSRAPVLLEPSAAATGALPAADASGGRSKLVFGAVLGALATAALLFATLRGADKPSPSRASAELTEGRSSTSLGAVAGGAGSSDTSAAARVAPGAGVEPAGTQGAAPLMSASALPKNSLAKPAWATATPPVAGPKTAKPPAATGSAKKSSEEPDLGY
jgi:serine/threonine protein kinase